MTPIAAYRFRMIFGLVLVTILLLTPLSALAQGEGPGQDSETGRYYVVRPGDTWAGIAATTGMPIQTILEANPEARHPHGYLWIGDRLLIPALESEPVPEPTATPSGYWYTVARGDDWNKLSESTGLSVYDLKAANPVAARDRHGWIYVGQQLWIPSGATPEATETAEAPEATPEPTAEPTATATAAGYWYDVKPGDDWYTVFEKTGVPVHDLKVANPTAASDWQGWLYIGQQLWIPQLPAADETPVAEVTDEPAATVEATETPSGDQEATLEPLTTEEPIAAATPVPTETVTPAATSAPTQEAEASATPDPTAEATVTEAEVVCPDALNAYPEAIAAKLTASSGNAKALATWLKSCGVISDDAGGVTESAAVGSAKPEVVAVIRTTPAGQEAKDELLAFHAAGDGYVLSHTVEGAGEIKLLKAEDINVDRKLDLVYVDTSCGTATCFSTLHIDSWDGSAFQDWTKGNLTMAGAEYSFENSVPDGQGLEILAHGGIINSKDAGPQRAWTETYISPEGGPYESQQKQYDASSCLYHQILDANDLFSQWTKDGFSPAIDTYEKAIADSEAEACGENPDELTKLADFARFRLMLSLVSRGQAAKAAEVQSGITYPPLVGAVKTFFDTMQSSRSIIQACRDVNQYAEENPGAWDFLSDWGYANPTFTAADLCPLD